MSSNEEELKYFIPEISDLHVGYECESLNALPEEERYWIPYVVGETTGTWNQFGGIRWAVENKHLRVPYLTKEQIEKEGWISYQGSTLIALNKGDFYIWYSEFSKILSIDQGKHPNKRTRFIGECKDINTFRKLMKLLGI